MHFWSTSSIISYLNQNRKFNHLIMVCNFKKATSKSAFINRLVDLTVATKSSPSGTQRV